jgi:hypothetical protein
MRGLGLTITWDGQTDRETQYVAAVPASRW